MNPIETDDGQPAWAAAHSLDRLGRELGWGLLVAGMIGGAALALERIAARSTSGGSYAGPVLEGLAVALLAGLAGRAASAGCRLASAIAVDRYDRRPRRDALILALAGRAVEALECGRDALTAPPAAAAPPDSTGVERARLRAEIDRAISDGRRADAESLLVDYVAASPDDPAIVDLRGRLEALRRREVEEHLAQLRAARQVNDHARVLELYRGVASSMEADPRGDLERELSRWFLEVIHRRLRGGRIQLDVVELATVVAETFGATMEGASLRASLPTLRRTVGLCPRCARPYVGTAAACPQCLGGPPPETAAGPGPPEGEPDPDAEGPANPPDPAAPEDRDAGWMSYDEDDGDDGVALA